MTPRTPAPLDARRGDAQAASPEKRGDRVYTPVWVAEDLIRHFRPSGRVLEPCAGPGEIFKRLGPNALWCEIDEGRDFFDFHDPVDWIVTNPPYSKTRPFFNHAMTIAEHIVFLVPARNIVSGYGFVRDVHMWGGNPAIRWYGTGSKLGFPMGNAIAAFHWQRGYSGATSQTFHDQSVTPTPALTSRGEK